MKARFQKLEASSCLHTQRKASMNMIIYGLGKRRSNSSTLASLMEFKDGMDRALCNITMVCASPILPLKLLVLEASRQGRTSICQFL